MSHITEANYVEEALLKMRSVPPNDDGTIGVMVQKGAKEWEAWRAYFLGKRMDHRAAFMDARDQYMVPCRDPAALDPDIVAVRQEYAFRLHRGEIGTKAERGRMVWELHPDEVASLLERIKGSVKTPAKPHRWGAADEREKVKPPEVRDLNEKEVASMKRLLGIREDEAQEAAE